MSREDLITEAFGYINSFKRHRALSDIKPQDKRYHELQMYKMIDYLELSMRAIKKDVRSGEDSSEESND